MAVLAIVRSRGVLLLAGGSAGLVGLAGGCGKEPPPPAPDFAPSSILDNQTPEPPVAEVPAPPVPADPPAVEETEAPALERERQSRSVLGRTRDSARGVRDALSGGTAAEEGLAELHGAEPVIEVEGLSFDIPEPWRIAIPSNAMRAGEVLIQSPAGNATITFTVAGGSAADNIRRWEGQVLDDIGDPVRARTETVETDGRTTTLAAMEGTYLDGPPMGAKTERPFWALHGAVIERTGRPTVFVKMFGPEDTVAQAAEAFSAMALGAR